MLNVVWLLIGFVSLFYGAHWLVRGASHIANAFGIPKAIVGLTLVAFGTSAPEFFVNVIAGYNGQSEIALANVSGSNLTNLCIGFGICALFTSVIVDRTSFRLDLIMLVLSAATVLGLLLINRTDPHLPFWSAFLLLGIFLAYLYSISKRKILTDEEPAAVSRKHLLLNFGLFFLGVVLLYIGGDRVLAGAVNIGISLNIEPEILGLTVVAAGTSIPDALASFVAAKRKEYGIAVGNLLGSNISNIVFVLSSTMFAVRVGGEAAVDDAAPAIPLGSLAASPELLIDYSMVLGVSVVFVIVVGIWGRLARWTGAALLATYFGYMAFRVYNVMA